MNVKEAQFFVTSSALLLLGHTTAAVTLGIN